MLQSIKKLGSNDFSDVPVEYPPLPRYGDYSTNIAILLANRYKHSLKELALKIIGELKKDRFVIDAFEEINEINGFLNFKISKKLAIDTLILFSKSKKFLQNLGRGECIVIDYSSPNIAKPMHVGHLRSTILGQAIANLYEVLGYKSVGINHLGDWGTQFGSLIAAYKLWGKKKIEDFSVDDMLELYIKFHFEKEKDERYEEMARLEFKKLEEGNKENRKIWKIFREKSLSEFNKIYKSLGIKFDYIIGESFYNEKAKIVIQESIKKGFAFKQADGSVVILLEQFHLIPFIIQKSDGTTLYGARDLAAIKHRVEKFKPAKMIYVIGSEQSLYLNQLFQSSELLNYFPKNKFYHLDFGLYLFKGKKMASRRGDLVKLSQIIEEVIEGAKKILKEKSVGKLKERDIEKVAKIIGIGALKYNDLSQNRKSNIEFDLEKMLSINGESGPYIQYTCVRLKNILRKAGLFAGKFVSIADIIFKDELEIRIAKKLALFPEIVKDSAISFQINCLAKYLYEIAEMMNIFYEKLPVLRAEKEYRISRLVLIKAALNVLRYGLDLLGIKVPDKM